MVTENAVLSLSTQPHVNWICDRRPGVNPANVIARGTIKDRTVVLSRGIGAELTGVRTVHRRLV